MEREVESENDMKWRKGIERREFLGIVLRTQPKSSSEFEEFVVKRVFQRCLVSSSLKREGLSISLSSRERLFQIR